MKWDRRMLWTAPAVVALVSMAGLWCHGRSYGEAQGRASLTAAYVRQIADLSHMVVTERNKTGDLMAAIAATDDPSITAGVVSETRGVITHVGSVTSELEPEIREVYVEVPVSIDATAPCLLGPLTVGEAKIEGTTLSCATYGLRHRLTLSMADVSSSALVQVATAEEPEEWHDVETALDITHIPPDPHKILSPALVLGLTGVVTLPDPQPVIAASLAFHWLHVTRNVDLLGLRVSGTSSSARIGLDIVGYTPGIKPFENTGLYLGGSYGTDGQASIDLTLGVRL